MTKSRFCTTEEFWKPFIRQVPKDLGKVDVFWWFASWKLTRDFLSWQWDTAFLLTSLSQLYLFHVPLPTLCFKAPQSNRQGCAYRMKPGWQFLPLQDYLYGMVLPISSMSWQVGDWYGPLILDLQTSPWQ